MAINFSPVLAKTPMHNNYMKKGLHTSWSTPPCSLITCIGTTSISPHGSKVKYATKKTELVKTQGSHQFGTEGGCTNCSCLLVVILNGLFLGSTASFNQCYLYSIRICRYPGISQECTMISLLLWQRRKNM